MGKKTLTEVKTIFDAASAMTVLVNKVFNRKYKDFYEMHAALEAGESKKRKRGEMNVKNEEAKEDEEENRG
jgi:hypothetical protein